MYASAEPFTVHAATPASGPDTLALHRRYLYRYALSKVREPDAAEELVQDTLVAALEGHARFRGASALRTWLAGILNHKITDWYRREARCPIREHPSSRFEREGEQDEPGEPDFDASGGWTASPSAWADPERALENSRFWQVLDRCLADLPSATARAFTMREIQGMSTDEICAELGITRANCYVMLHRARLCLRSGLEARWFAAA